MAIAVITSAIQRTHTWVIKRLFHGLYLAALNRSQVFAGSVPDTCGVRGSFMPVGSSQPAIFTAANGNSSSQNARAVRPELMDDQLYASTVR